MWPPARPVLSLLAPTLMRASLLLILPLLLPALANAQASPLTLVSPFAEASGYFGTAVAGVPDVNGDGQGDFLVGASGESVAGTRSGRAYLYTSSVLREIRSPNPEAFGKFGGAVAGVDDVNGDGRGDVLIGAEDENGGATDAGRAYLVHDTADADAHA